MVYLMGCSPIRRSHDMVSEVVQVAELLPSHAVNEFLKNVKPSEDDVMALWECQSRRYPFVEQSQCDFVDIATRCGLAPHSLVEQWLGNADYAPYAAAHDTNISEDDVLAIAGKPGCSYALRNPILPHDALWREAKRRRGAWTDLAHLFANEARRQPYWKLARDENIGGCGRASPVTPLRRTQCSRLYCSQVGAIAS